MDIQGVKRPKTLKDEDEDDLLQMQEQFIKSQPSNIAAKVTKVGSKKTKKPFVDEGDKPERIVDNHDIPQSLHLQVIERDVSQFKEVKGPTVVKHLSFPSIKKINLDDKTSGSTKQSLFAKQFGIKKKTTETSTCSFDTSGSILDGSGLGHGGRYEVDKIHEDNRRRLQGMSIEEIEAARQEILSKMDSSKLELFKKLRQQKDQSLKQPEEDVVMTEQCERIVSNCDTVIDSLTHVTQ